MFDIPRWLIYIVGLLSFIMFIPIDVKYSSMDIADMPAKRPRHKERKTAATCRSNASTSCGNNVKTCHYY
jgi:hypothetical protein